MVRLSWIAEYNPIKGTLSRIAEYNPI